ncbi:MAG: thioredoxin domain-containing protein [Candidatus Moraniibacteriota bacterium]|jgi:protein-disulfide isomerase
MDKQKEKIQESSNKDTGYRTHWHSFWFGAMCALAIVLLFLLIGTITNKISFGKFNPKQAPIQKTKVVAKKSVPKLSLDATLVSMDINKEEFDICMEEKRYADAVQSDIDSGKKAGVQGTPHSFVLIDDAIYEIPGAQTEKGIREFFDDLLAGNDPQAKDISNDREIDTVTADDWIKGGENARITVIEYSDVDCPFCKKFHTSTLNLMGDYKDDVKWVFRHFPIDGLHPNARTKSEAAECIGEIGGGVKFWEYLDILFQE